MKIKLKDTLSEFDDRRRLKGLDRLISDILDKPVRIKDEYRSAVQEEIYLRLKKTHRLSRRYKFLNERYLSSNSLKSHAKIARSFDVSRAAVSQSISRTIRDLKRSFEEDDSITIEIDEKLLPDRKLNYSFVHEVIDRIFQNLDIEMISISDAKKILKDTTAKTSLEGVDFSEEMLKRCLVGDYRTIRDFVVRNRLFPDRQLKDFRKYNFSIYTDASSNSFETIECEKLRSLCDINDLANDVEFHDYDRALLVANSVILDMSRIAFDLGFSDFRKTVDLKDLSEFLRSEDLSIESSRLVALSKLVSLSRLAFSPRLDISSLYESDTDRLISTRLSNDQIEFFDRFFSAEIRLNGYDRTSEILVRSSSLKIYDLLHESKIVMSFDHSEYPSLAEKIYDLLRFYESISDSSSEIDFIERLHALNIFEDDLIRYIYRVEHLDKTLNLDDFYVILNQDDLVQLRSELKRFFKIDRSLEDLRSQYAAF